MLPVYLSFLIALFLQAIPMPLEIQGLRPEWLAMVLIYWVLAMPERVGVTTAWLLGMVLDGIEGALLGQNAFALSMVAYVTLILYQRIRMFEAWQQAFIVFVLIGLDQLLCNWTRSLQGGTAPSLAFLMPALISALLWPALMILLRQVRRRFGQIKPL